MADWNRSTPWRQGHVLTDQTAAELELHCSEVFGSELAVVISHDCDIANSSDDEPNIEVIIGRRISKVDGNFAHGRNARKLHISFDDGEESCIAELLAVDKLLVSKQALIVQSPSEKFKLSARDIQVLQRWLAARYRRAAFPDAFDRRLNEGGFADKLRKIFKPSGKYIRTVFFDVDDGEEITRQDPQDTYSLRIYIVYTSEPSYEDAEAAAVAVQAELNNAFRKHFADTEGRWQNIELVDCDVISDEALSYHQSQSFKEWRLEYMSLRENPPQPTI